MHKKTILLVDDEPISLLLAEQCLLPEGFCLEKFTDAEQAWQRLSAADSNFSLLILDRNMPGLDGLAFLQRLHADPRHAELPVIMQTAADTPEEVRQGLAAGAHYYLTKPSSPAALLSIVHAALDDRAARAALREHAARLESSQREVQKLLVNAQYRFASLPDVSALVPMLAALCPEPDRVAPGLSELMVNAIEHGNLGISYEEKAELKWEGGWEEEIRRRLALPQYRNRQALITLERHPQHLVFRIVDQGAGFAWANYLDFDPERAFDANGRGIAMARATSFSHLEYSGRGNIVSAWVDLPG
ncbi:response regulator [Azonexus sp.]|uniref:response regulator n=1 Tax=Azonexus sp. TaxID=1872668 RepID=UPI0039E6568C